MKSSPALWGVWNCELYAVDGFLLPSEGESAGAEPVSLPPFQEYRSGAKPGGSAFTGLLMADSLWPSSR